MNARILHSAAILLVACLGMSAAAPADELGRRATWSQPTPAQVKAAVMQWLEGKSLDDLTQAKIDALWPAELPAMSNADLLQQVAATFAAVDPLAGEVVQFCRGRRQRFAAPEFAILSDEAAPAFVRSNLRLLFGQWLAQQQLYDEALAVLKDVRLEEVVDPASLLFYQSVAYHRVLDKENCLPTIRQLLENEDQIPRRYVSVAKLMEADLAPLKPDSLDEIARLMDAIRVELEHARAGRRVRQRQDDVIAKLDKLIEELEKQRQQQQSAGGGSSAPPSTPAPDSQNAPGRGEGKVPPKKLKGGADWGNLPPKEREEALQQISQEFPSHFREVIEEYFRKLARDNED